MKIQVTILYGTYNFYKPQSPRPYSNCFQKKILYRARLWGPCNCNFFYLECNICNFGGNKIEIETKPKLLKVFCLF